MRLAALKLAAAQLAAADPAVAQLQLPISLLCGKLRAEFFLDSRFVPFIYHYTLTRPNEPEILHWGQEYSEQAAHASAETAAADFTACAAFRLSRFTGKNIA